MSKNRGQQHYNVSMEDFNDNVGKTVAQKTSLGPHGVDLRNAREHATVDVAENHLLKIMNTFFDMKALRRGTWKFTSGLTN